MNAAVPTTRQSNYRRIADAIRGQIIEGVWTPGAQLPATDKLADTWKASYGTVHTALQRLVKEGWVERLDGSGTYVAEFHNRFACAGIYHARDIFSSEESLFARALHTALLKRLGAMDKKTLVFVDSRPEEQQGEALPDLVDAVRLRRIQCILAPTVNQFDVTSLARMPVPSAFTVNPASSSQVIFDKKSLMRGAVRELVRQGCRTIGLLSHITHEGDGIEERLYENFEAAVAHEGAATRPEWIRRPAENPLELERFGYHEFKAFWSLPEKPEGFIVYPDTVARGVITAVLELGVTEMTARMKFVFHRNAPARLLCPFAATWAVSDVERVAAEMIALVERQFAGEKTEPVLLDHEFEASGPLT